MDNIFEDAKRSISRSLIEYYFNTNKAYWKKDEFWTLNPLRHDSEIGSFSISDQGYYKDFASQDKGDFITLVSEYFRISKKEAAEKILNDTGNFIPDEKTHTPHKEKKLDFKAVSFGKKTEPAIRNKIIELAEKSHNTKDRHGNEFKVIRFYEYIEYKTEQILFYIARYECEELKEKGEKYKKFHPFCIDDTGKIHQKMPVNFKPYPFFQINNLSGNNNPVIIVMGEKCARVKVEGFNLVTFSGGDNNYQYFDYTQLKKRDEVYIWPDNDESGISTAKKIKTEFLPQAVIFDVEKLGKPEKWDIANASEEGLNILELIEEMKKSIKEYPPIDPYYAYKKFINDIYGPENLLQIDGVMWRYLEKRHFWEQIKKENLSVDFQIWMEKSGAIEILDNLEKSKHQYKSQACSFISNHGMEYYNDNFFKYSAISPFIHFKNGAIELNEDGYKFHSREKNEENFFRNLHPVNCFDYEYKEDLKEKVNFQNIKKYAPLFYYFIESIIPDDIKKNEIEVKKTFMFIFQIIAYCMSPFKPNEYFFGFYGDQGSAKSSFFKLIALFIGEDFIVNRSFEDFKGNRFATNDLWNAKIYVDEDIAENQPLPDDFIKRNSGNVKISVEPKHQSTVKGVAISITMFFISNYEFKATGVEGIDRRAIIVHFKNKLPEKQRDKLILERISGQKQHDKKTPDRAGEIFDERPYILNMILESWNEFIDNNHVFTFPDWIKTSSDKMKTAMSSIGTFFICIINEEIQGLNKNEIYTMKDYYEKYKDWCSEEGRRPKGRTKFYEDFLRIKDERYSIEQSRHSTMGNIFKIIDKEKENSKKVKQDNEDYELSKVF